MTKASIKSKYEPSAQATSATLSFGLGDLKLKAGCTDRTLEHSPSVTGVSFGVEKPGFFIFDYDVPKQAARFQFMNSFKLLDKQVKLTYIHPQKANATVLETSLLFDPANKVTGKYSFLSGKGSLKYSYVHSSGMTFEPSYDFHTNAWSFSASKRIPGENTLKASYETSRKVLDLEWTGDSKETGAYKITCTVHSNDTKNPRLAFEKTWNLEF